ncbi:MAG: hypothetical protein IKC71_03440 [Clostridia bacterium]|nr:hypothetical protein [Clostridia bacterium]
MNDKKLKDALYKKAVGFETEEVTEEYQEKEGDIALIKRKVTKKTVPPDITALKMIMEEEKGVRSMTDEELEKEKQRLLLLLKKGEDDERV